MYIYVVEKIDPQTILDDHIIGIYDTFEKAYERMNNFAIQHDIPIIEDVTCFINEDWQTFEYFFDSMDDTRRFIINKIKVNAPSLLI